MATHNQVSISIGRKQLSCNVENRIRTVTNTEGAQAFAEFAARLPSTAHEVQSYDCHPLVASNTSAGAAPDIMLIVSGSVKYGFEANARGFSQTFNLKQDPEKPGTYYVDTDCFRQVVLA